MLYNIIMGLVCFAVAYIVSTQKQYNKKFSKNIIKAMFFAGPGFLIVSTRFIENKPFSNLIVNIAGVILGLFAMGFGIYGFMSNKSE